MSLFKKAKRDQSKLKIALTGPSGAGKTYSALSIAKGLGGKIAVVDTECGSASLYSDKFDFDCANMNPPYDIAKYEKSIDAAVEAGYDVLILDSITHAWAGEGGLLDKKSALDATNKGNSYTNWAKLTPMQNKFMSKILSANIHIIATMRSKVEYSLEDINGKKVPKKIGMAPIQRDGVEYEFTVVLDLSTSHMCDISKDRTGLFDGQNFVPSEKTGQALMAWLKGVEIQEEAQKEVSNPKEVTQAESVKRAVEKHSQREAIR